MPSVPARRGVGRCGACCGGVVAHGAREGEGELLESERAREEVDVDGDAAMDEAEVEPRRKADDCQIGHRRGE